MSFLPEKNERYTIFKTFPCFAALAPAVSGLLQTNLPTFPRGRLGPVSAGAGSEPFKTR